MVLSQVYLLMQLHPKPKVHKENDEVNSAGKFSTLPVESFAIFSFSYASIHIIKEEKAMWKKSSQKFNYIYKYISCKTGDREVGLQTKSNLYLEFIFKNVYNSDISSSTHYNCCYVLTEFRRKNKILRVPNCFILLPRYSFLDTSIQIYPNEQT